MTVVYNDTRYLYDELLLDYNGTLHPVPFTGDEPTSTGDMTRTAGTFHRALTGTQPMGDDGSVARRITMFRLVTGNQDAAVGAAIVWRWTPYIWAVYSWLDIEGEPGEVAYITMDTNDAVQYTHKPVRPHIKES